MIKSGFFEQETIIESSHDTILVLDVNANVIKCNNGVKEGAIIDHYESVCIRKHKSKVFVSASLRPKEQFGHIK